MLLKILLGFVACSLSGNMAAPPAPPPPPLTLPPPIPISTSEPVTCDDGWEQWESSCYKFFMSSKYYTDALDNCYSMGADLVVVESSLEEEFVTNMTAGILYYSPHVWMGVHNAWSTADGVFLAFTSWIRDAFAASEPEETENSCLGFKRSWPNMRLVDDENSLQQQFLCEATEPCPVGLNFVNNGTCYGVSPTKLRHGKALITCQSLGGKLVDFESEEEFNFVRDLLYTNTSVTSVWTGYCFDLSNFVVMATGQNVTYTNWAPLEPSIWYGIPCVYLYDGMWGTDPCTYWWYYICEKDGKPLTTGQAATTETTPVPEVITTPSSGPCEFGWTQFEQSCYLFVPLLEDYKSAQDKCSSMGADLAVGETTAEEIFISNLAWGLTTWTGVSSAFQTAEGLNLAFTPWVNDAVYQWPPPITEQSCYRWINFWPTWQLYPEYNIYQYSYICESLEPCPMQLNHVKNGRCYGISPMAADHATAVSTCQAMGAKLLDMEDEEEFNFLLNFLNNLMNIWDIWTGYCITPTSYAVRSTGQNASFIKWAPTEPSVPSGVPCVYMQAGLWGADPCSTLWNYVCEKKESPAESTTLLPVTTTTAITSDPEIANKNYKFRNRFLNYLFNDTKPLYIGPCETGWTRFQRSCYKMVPTYWPWNYEYSTDRCIALNSVLAPGESVEEEAFITSLAWGHDTWLGVGYAWQTAVGQTLAFTTWIVNDFYWSEPSTFWDSCLAFKKPAYYYTYSYLYDELKTSERNFMCESTAPCAPELNVTNNATDTCYGVPDIIGNYSTALDVCQSYNAKLVDFDDQEEFDFVKNVMHTETTAMGIWLGYCHQNSTFVTLATGQDVDYTNWAPGEPTTGGFENCVALSSGMWYMKPCYQGHIVVCKQTDVTNTTEAATTEQTTTEAATTVQTTTEPTTTVQTTTEAATTEQTTTEAATTVQTTTKAATTVQTTTEAATTVQTTTEAATTVPTTTEAATTVPTTTEAATTVPTTTEAATTVPTTTEAATTVQTTTEAATTVQTTTEAATTVPTTTEAATTVPTTTEAATTEQTTTEAAITVPTTTEAATTVQTTTEAATTVPTTTEAATTVPTTTEAATTVPTTTEAATTVPTTTEATTTVQTTTEAATTVQTTTEAATTVPTTTEAATTVPTTTEAATTVPTTTEAATTVPTTTEAATTEQTAMLSTTPTLPPCDPGWIQFQQSCYYTDFMLEMQSVAAQNCYLMGSELVVMDSAEEEIFVDGLTMGMDTWLGIRYPFQTATGQILAFTPWIRKALDFFEPDAMFGSCLALRRSATSMLLIDDTELLENHFMCESPAPCDPALNITNNGICYGVPDIIANHSTAVTTCQNYNAKLVDIENEGEYDFILSTLFNETTAQTVWTAYCMDTFEFKVTATGQDLVYTNWDIGEPFILNNCAYYFLGMWWSNSCMGLAYYVCEKSARGIIIVPPGATTIQSVDTSTETTTYAGDTTTSATTTSAAGTATSAMDTTTSAAATSTAADETTTAADETTTSTVVMETSTSAAAISTAADVPTTSTVVMETTTSAAATSTAPDETTTAADETTTSTVVMETSTSAAAISTAADVPTTSTVAMETTTSAAATSTAADETTTAADETTTSTVVMETSTSAAAISTAADVPTTSTVAMETTTSAAATSTAADETTTSNVAMETTATTASPTSTAGTTDRLTTSADTPLSTPIPNAVITSTVLTATSDNMASSIISTLSTTASVTTQGTTTENSVLTTGVDTVLTTTSLVTNQIIAMTTAESAPVTTPPVEELPPTCGAPPQADNANVTAEGDTIGSIAIYQCYPGYRFMGGGDLRSILCQSNRLWSALVDRCEAILCEAPSSVHAVNVTEDSRLVDRVVRFECDEGDRFSDGQTATWTVCNRQQKWNNAVSPCRKRCGALPYVANDRVGTYQTNASDQAILIDCLPYHRLSDGRDWQHIRCDADYTWTETLECKIETCEPLPALLNAQLNTTTVDCGTSVLVTCDNGFKFDDNATSKVVQCGSEKTWSHNISDCIIAKCPAIPTISNGVKVGTSLLVNATVTYTCFPGYRLQDGHSQTTIICDGTAQWNQSLLSCEMGRCLPVPTITYASGNTTSADAGSLVRYDCQLGYQFPDGETYLYIVCQSGSWTTSYMACIPRRCPPYPTVENAIVQSTANPSVGDDVTIICDSGYHLNGNSSAQEQCTTSASWSAVYTSCPPVSCGYTPAINNSVIQEMVLHSFGDNITYECLPGFWISHGHFSKIINCGEYGTWQPNPQECKRIECLPLPIWDGLIANTSDVHVTTLVSVTCTNGSYFADKASYKIIECGYDGEWFPETPECAEDNPEKMEIPLTEAEKGNMVAIASWVMVGVPLAVIVLLDLVTLIGKAKSGHKRPSKNKPDDIRPLTGKGFSSIRPISGVSPNAGVASSAFSANQMSGQAPRNTPPTNGQPPKQAQPRRPAPYRPRPTPRGPQPASNAAQANGKPATQASNPKPATNKPSCPPSTKNPTPSSVGQTPPRNGPPATMPTPAIPGQPMGGQAPPNKASQPTGRPKPNCPPPVNATPPNAGPPPNIPNQPTGPPSMNPTPAMPGQPPIGQTPPNIPNQPTGPPSMNPTPAMPGQPPIGQTPPNIPNQPTGPPSMNPTPAMPGQPPIGQTPPNIPNQPTGPPSMNPTPAMPGQPPIGQTPPNIPNQPTSPPSMNPTPAMPGQPSIGQTPPNMPSQPSGPSNPKGPSPMKPAPPSTGPTPPYQPKPSKAFPAFVKPAPAANSQPQVKPPPAKTPSPVKPTPAKNPPLWNAPKPSAPPCLTPRAIDFSFDSPRGSPLNGGGGPAPPLPHPPQGGGSGNASTPNSSTPPKDLKIPELRLPSFSDDIPDTDWLSEDDFSANEEDAPSFPPPSSNTPFSAQFGIQSQFPFRN